MSKLKFWVAQSLSGYRYVFVAHKPRVDGGYWKGTYLGCDGGPPLRLGHLDLGDDWEKSCRRVKWDGEKWQLRVKKVKPNDYKGGEIWHFEHAESTLIGMITKVMSNYVHVLVSVSTGNADGIRGETTTVFLTSAFHKDPKTHRVYPK